MASIDEKKLEEENLKLLPLEKVKTYFSYVSSPPFSPFQIHAFYL
jgi:hypothetical protein